MRAILAFLLLAVALSGCQGNDSGSEQGHDEMPNGHSHTLGMTHGEQPQEPGQSAFAALQEVVQILESDPQTDWSKVDILALRAHLVDMSTVMLDLQVSEEATPTGVRIALEGSDDALAAASRMIPEHAPMVDDTTGWQSAWQSPTLTVSAPANEVAHLQALGFYGWLATGAHHQEHHLALAMGEPMHQG